MSRPGWALRERLDRGSIPLYEELGDDESAGLGRDALAVIEGIGR